MSRKSILSIVLFISTFIFTFTQLSAQEEGEIIVISERVGQEIDHFEEIQARNIDIKPTQNTQNLEKLGYSNLGTAVYFELLGKGFFSSNIDFRIKDNHRFSIGITLLEYGGEKEKNEIWPEEKYFLSPGIMYYFITGVGPRYFEVGAGVNISPWNIDYYESRFTLHSVIGYRYQKKDGKLFRAGFTPLYRVNGEFFPLFGFSFGYSW